ncbi:guanine nucleotide-binding protein subunit gamma-e-like [Hydractinia symbiolongicarpus]|uniref:guanine nucleotide-binding protein subunit gamma-e-like n=1 Tax=Hydractinia symbiolongicarpus TaxID=13093 RepID=UPI00254F9604|nr:guanine nucleotide-binding protein subunit gamma-e-like [Hydractinia symbiolongicarpus]
MEKSLQLQNVESLRVQLSMERIPVSKAANELKEYCLQNEPNDPLVNPGARKANPWAEKSKCNVL